MKNEHIGLWIAVGYIQCPCSLSWYGHTVEGVPVSGHIVGVAVVDFITCLEDWEDGKKREGGKGGGGMERTREETCAPHNGRKG